MNVSQSWLELKFRGSELSSDSCRLPGSNELGFCENFLSSALASDSKKFSSAKFQMVPITIEMKPEALPISPSSVVRHNMFSQKCQLFLAVTRYLKNHLKLGIWWKTWSEKFMNNLEATVEEVSKNRII